VEYGKMPSYAGETPTKAATAQYTYTFDGWEPALTEVNGEQSYTAKFTETPRKYTITWQNDDGTTIDTTEVKYGELPNHEVPEKAADAGNTYTFSGWSPALSVVTGDATYKATYTSETRSYTITWKDDQGNTIDTTSVEYGATPLRADPTKAATTAKTFTFAGWEPAVTAVTGDATYTATFTEAAREYTITWLNEDGSEIDRTTVAYGTVPSHADPT
jgi:hypothetical protein